ncbi:MAG: uracil-DNA glycosylase [Clostridia bacterium]|jgi:DNA polymerase|nr:uracil-DNA glycosylase [Clostridia bacterium]
MYKDWESLKKDCSVCRKCGLCETRNNLVFGVGNEKAEVMFVGEGPGYNEDMQGEPFVGRGGQLLDKYLTHIGLDRHKNIYIANMVKCRPPENRDPSEEELNCCIDWLREQTRLIRPKIMVCLGRISAMRLISKDFRVTQQHGQFIEKGGILFMGTFHPAALLRNPNNKGLALEDFLALQEKIKKVCDHTYEV